jgi:hypothetical protein
MSSPAQAQPQAPATNDTPDYDALAAQNGALAAGGETPGEQTNDVGNTVIVPKEGESFADTMKRAAAQGKKTTPEQINKELATAPEKVAEVGAATALPLLPEAISALGTAATGTISENLPAITKAAQSIGTWAKANPATALGVMWAVNKGLSALGLPKASRLVEEMELPMLLLLGKGPAAESEAAASEAAGSEATASETAPAAEETSGADSGPSQFKVRHDQNGVHFEPNDFSIRQKTAAEDAAMDSESAGDTTAGGASPKESAEDFVKRMAPGGGSYNAKPNAAGTALTDDTAAGEAQPDSNDAEDFLSKENRQTAVDKYYEEHPEKRPQPQVAKRGPNKGQVRTYKVFDPESKTWTVVPKMK